MAVTREQIEKSITDKMQQQEITREQGIDELLDGAETGAGRAEREGLQA